MPHPDRDLPDPQLTPARAAARPRRRGWSAARRSAGWAAVAATIGLVAVAALVWEGRELPGAGPQARVAEAPAAGATSGAAPPVRPPAAAPLARAVPAAPAAPAAPPTVAAGWEAWTQARIEAGADSVVVPRLQAQVLAPLLARMLRAPAASAALTPEAQLRIELAQGEQDLGVLELAGTQWRWLPLRDGRQASGLLPEAALATALEAEARRLLEK